MLELYIIRHGKTIWNGEHKIQGSADIRLTDEGRETAQLTQKVWASMGLCFDAVYSSPLQRAYETACILTAHMPDIQIRKDDRLKELCFGALEGQSFDHIRDPQFDPEHGYFFTKPERYETPENGESLEDISIRAGSFLEDLFKQHTAGRILIVAHGTLNKALLKVLLNRKISRFWDGSLQKNCGTAIVQIDQGRCQVIDEGRIYY